MRQEYHATTCFALRAMTLKCDYRIQPKIAIPRAVSLEFFGDKLVIRTITIWNYLIRLPGVSYHKTVICSAVIPPAFERRLSFYFQRKGSPNFHIANDLAPDNSMISTAQNVRALKIRNRELFVAASSGISDFAKKIHQ